MSRGKIIAAVVAVLVVAGIVAAVVFGGNANRPTVTTAVAEQQTLEVVVSASGKVEAGVKSDVYPPSQGVLDKVFVTDGQLVKAGDELAQMDTGALEQQRDQAQAGYEAANAQYVGAEVQEPSRAQRNAAQAQVNAAYAAYLQAKRSYTDAKKMYDLTVQTTTSPVAIQNAKSARDQAKTGISQAFAGYEQALAAKAGLSKSAEAANASERAALASRDNASESIRLANNAIEDALMKAPIAGTVIFNSLSVSPTGQGPKAGHGIAVSPAAPVFSVVNLGALQFTAEVDETDIARVKVGMPAKVSLDAFPSDTFEAKVTEVKPAALVTATGGTAFPVVISLEGVNKDLKLGMGGNADIQVSGVQGAVTVPIEAVFDEGGDSYVYKVENDVLRRVKVKLGATTDTQAQILEGVKEGDVVALSGPVKFKDGLAVKTK